MELVFAVATKRIVLLEESDFALEGIVKAFPCASFPCKVDFMVAAMIEHDPVNAGREYEALVQLVSPEGKIVERFGSLNRANYPKHEKLRPYGTMGVTFTDVSLEAPGDYELQVMLGGKLMKTIRLPAYVTP